MGGRNDSRKALQEVYDCRNTAHRDSPLRVERRSELLGSLSRVSNLKPQVYVDYLHAQASDSLYHRRTMVVVLVLVPQLST